MKTLNQIKFAFATIGVNYDVLVKPELKAFMIDVSFGLAITLMIWVMAWSFMA